MSAVSAECQISRVIADWMLTKGFGGHEQGQSLLNPSTTPFLRKVCHWSLGVGSFGSAFVPESPQQKPGEGSPPQPKEGGPPSAQQPPASAGQQPNDSDTQRAPGQMSREEARQLLDSQKGEERHAIGLPVAHRENDTPPEKPLKDW